ncbi:MAG: rod shape-determining protein MreC [Gemmatimonadota bacterium]|nr:rod shape-determining protein MreC [Gemmatimonadota bacterium]
MIRSTILRPVLAMQNGVADRNALLGDPATLRAQRDSMAAFLVGQTTLASENRQLREMLGLRDRLPRRFVSAEVVRIPERGNEAFFMVTAGSDQGVRPGAAIVAAEGLVGLVRDVDSATSFGLDWTHPEFRASAMTLDGEIYGIVEPRDMSGEPVLLLTGTPRHVDLAPGVMIVTSGQGGVYPTGIPIGVVIGPADGEDGWQRNYLVRPLVGPSEMNYVLILGDSDSSSAKGQDLAESWGIRLGEQQPVDGTLVQLPESQAVNGPGTEVVARPAVSTVQPAAASAPRSTPAAPATETRPAAVPDTRSGPALLGEPAAPR